MTILCHDTTRFVVLTYNSTFACFGWLLNYHTTGFGLFVGMDHSLGKLTKEGISLSGNGHFNMGVNFPL